MHGGSGVGLVLLLAAYVTTDQSCVQLPCILQQATADIVMIYDRSDAFTNEAAVNLRVLMKGWAHKYSIGPSMNQVQFSMISYDSGGNAYSSFIDGSPNLAEMDATFDNDITAATTPRAARNFSRALEKLINNDDGIDGYRVNAYHAILVVSAGKWDDSYSIYKPMLDRARCCYPNVFGIVYGPRDFKDNFDQLSNITDTGSNEGNVFLAASYSGVEYALGWILAKVSCTNPLPTVSCTCTIGKNSRIAQ